MARKEVGFVVTDDYKTWIEEVKNKIRNSQIKASVRINYEMLDLYWNLGVATVSYTHLTLPTKRIV